MSLLKDLVTTNEGNDLSRLPQDVITAIKSNIRKGADDLTQQWANALELVQKAYEVEGAARPTPDMDAAWKQYEENLQYAVQQLAKSRGMEDDWRMSSHIFREAREPIQKFNVQIDDDTFIVEGKDINDVVDGIVEQLHGIDVTRNNYGTYTELDFSKWGIKHRTKVVVETI